MPGGAPIGGAPLGAPLPLVSTAGGEIADTLAVADTLDVVQILPTATSVEILETLGVSSLDTPVKAVSVFAEDELVDVDEPTTIAGKVVRERLRLPSSLSANQHLNLRASDAMALQDVALRTLELLMSEELGLELTHSMATSIAVVEALQLQRVLLAEGLHQMSAVDTINLVDSLAQFFGADLEEGLVLSETLAILAKYAGLVTDEITFDETALTPQLLISAVTTESVHLEPLDAVQMLYNPALIDGVEISAGYVAPDGGFTAWAMNTRSGAVTEYRNFAFNSFAQFGTTVVGAAGDGLYELVGDDDAGVSILATLRGGYMQFGGGRMSRLKAAYISVRAPDGGVYLKIIAGDGAEYRYRVDTRSMRNTKVHMGKGQRARYFAYELTTTGQDFDLDTIEFVPLVVQRRV